MNNSTSAATDLIIPRRQRRGIHQVPSRLQLPAARGRPLPERERASADRLFWRRAQRRTLPQRFAVEANTLRISRTVECRAPGNACRKTVQWRAQRAVRGHTASAFLVIKCRAGMAIAFDPQTGYAAP